jgi:hypothetical protein
MALQIDREVQQDCRLVSNIAERLVAVEAQQPSNLACGVVVIDVRGGDQLAAGAQTALLKKHSVVVHLTDSIPLPEVVLAKSTMALDLAVAPTFVVTRLAVPAVPRRVRPVPRELAQWLRGLAVRTPALPQGKDAGLLHGASYGRLSLAVRGLRALAHA